MCCVTRCGRKMEAALKLRVLMLLSQNRGVREKPKFLAFDYVRNSNITSKGKKSKTVSLLPAPHIVSVSYTLLCVNEFSSHNLRQTASVRMSQRAIYLCVSNRFRICSFGRLYADESHRGLFRTSWARLGPQVLQVHRESA